MLELAEGDVHVWQASLDLPGEEFQRLNDTLSEDEKKRAERFLFAKDRQHFIAARGILRDVLAGYIQMPAHELKFDYGKQGKPFLVDGSGCDLSLQFNLSHSNGMALYAVTRYPVGIDIEFSRKEVDVLGIAKRFFTDREFQALSNLPEPLQQHGFFCYWTLKEAVVKALGSGLFLSLDHFEVRCLLGDSPALLEVEGSAEKAAAWTIYPVKSGENYVATLAILGKVNSPRYLQWAGVYAKTSEAMLG